MYKCKKNIKKCKGKINLNKYYKIKLYYFDVFANF